MAYGVSQWPYSPDPRGPDFAIKGWDFGQVPPYRWTVKTTDALYPYDIFNQGVRIEPWYDSPSLSLYRPVDTLPLGITCEMSIFGSQIPIGGGAGTTIQIFLVIGAAGVDPVNGVIRMLWPTAIKKHGPIDMTSMGLPSEEFPNPATITPRKWNA